MTFEELKNYNDLVGEAWLKVPMTDNTGDIACCGMYCYNKAVTDFLNAGRIYYSNDNLTMDELTKLFNTELCEKQQTSHCVITDCNAIVEPQFSDDGIQLKRSSK